MDRFPAIPGAFNVKGCLEKVKEALEIGLGRRGLRNAEGRYLDKFITFRELEDLILASDTIGSAVAHSVSVKYGMNDPVDVTIASGVITVTGSGLVTVSSESGTTDQLDRISGLAKGNTVYVVAGSGHTITVTAGTYLKLPSPNWILSGYRIATFDCMGGDICVMRSHEANRT